MANLIKIICENTKTSLFVNEGASLNEILNMVYADESKKYIAAWVDNSLKDLSERLYSERSVRFVEIDSAEGLRIYTRTTFFILGKAISDVLPGHRLRVMHHVGAGYYCEIDGLSPVPEDITAQIKSRMAQLISANLPIVRTKVEYSEAIEMYIKKGALDKVALLKTRPRFFVTMYNLAGEIDYFFGATAQTTSIITSFDLHTFYEGIMVLMPDHNAVDKMPVLKLQPKLLDVFRQNKQWVNILGIPNIGRLNEKLMKGEGGEMIKVGEALQEKNFAAIADAIHHREKIKLILIAGPSSSGKTSSAKRLSIQLKVLGYEPHLISLDNYFVEREMTPKDEDGNYDYECLEALDVAKFNQDLLNLFDGKAVEMCKFSFHSGKRFLDGEMMQMNERSIIIVEGIHGLNPKLIPQIDDEVVFKIYASALTTLSMDDMNVVRTTDNRLLRRMVRDHKYRSRSAYETIKSWQSVRRGEDKHIFPYQENADVMLGTSLFFEIPILKRYAIPLLNEVPENVPEYAEALRLVKFLNSFVEMSDTELPPTSILREFIGGSSFTY